MLRPVGKGLGKPPGVKHGLHVHGSKCHRMKQLPGSAAAITSATGCRDDQCLWSGGVAGVLPAWQPRLHQQIVCQLQRQPGLCTIGNLQLLKAAPPSGATAAVVGCLAAQQAVVQRGDVSGAAAICGLLLSPTS